MVEMMVIVLIVGLLLGVGMWSIRSARQSGQTVAAIAAAQAYADAVDEFARDHGGSYPSLPSDWNANLAKGPQDTVLSTDSASNRYLRRVPESIQDGTVTIAASASPSKPTIVYAAENGNRGYRIEIHVPGRDTCAVRGGNATSTSPATCSAR